MKVLVKRYDKNGIQLKEGDIVAECNVGDIIWEGQGQIETRPLGVVKVYYPELKSMLPPEEGDFYNIIPLRAGKVKILKRDGNLKYLNISDDYTDIYLSRYDGDFYAWNNIEIVGSIYDLAK